MNKKTLIFLLISTFFFTFSCSKNKEEADGAIKIKKKRIEPNVKKRTAEARDQGFTLFGGKSADPFAKNNIMWRATIEVLDFAPIGQASYSGGVYSTDWYSPSNSSGKESIKINVVFVSKEIAANSFNINGFKKNCQINNNCKITKTSNQFNRKIKDAILEKIKELRIADEKKK